MIDEQARADIRAAVDAYLSDRIGAFEFEERLFAIDTEDATASFVVGQLWLSAENGSERFVKTILTRFIL